MVGDKLYALRIKNKMSQEELAEKIGVSRQALQKWEINAGLPTVDNLIKISEIFGTTLDYLCRASFVLRDNSGRLGEELLPSYEDIHDWELYSKALEIDYRQCYDEGKDIEAYKDLFFATAKIPHDDVKEKISEALYALTGRLPRRKEYPYDEPNDYGMIRANGSGYTTKLQKSTGEKLADQVLGGWYGKICGCFLGKPVEGIYRDELEKILRATKNFPLSRYIDAEDLPEGIETTVSFPIRMRAYPRTLGRMPIDDDTNYVLIGYEILRRYGRDFTSADVAETWMDSQTKNAYCTAERIAYKNIINGYFPPASGKYKNAYREWIGAQIRADFFGYINPCAPGKAAEMAYRDACVSHVKNGIYGEMWVAGMIAAAYGTKNVCEIILSGLGQIPQKSRLYEAVKNIVDDFDKGIEAEECMKGIRLRWDEKKGYDWCHVISNAEIVTAALLYGNGDWAKSVCLAVEQAFDTDCNGATVGSVLGVMLGFKALPASFTDRICDTLESSLFGYSSVSVREMAKKTMEFIN